MATAATVSYTQAKEFAIARGNQQHPFTLSQFMDEIHRMFYSHVDISFKDYFMELVEQEGQFVVHHSKLIEYGVVTSKRSSDIKNKLDALGMVEGDDYRLRDIPQPVKQGGYVTTNHYILTPESFKFCLARSRRYTGQPVDPVIYFRYFLLLEKMVKLFSLYESTKKDAELASRDRTISEQAQRIEFMFAEIQRGREEAKRDRSHLIGRVDDVVEKLDDTNGQLIIANEKLEEVVEKLDDANEKLEEVVEKLDEANDQLIIVNEKLDDAELARHIAEMARDEKAEALLRQMIVSGALSEDKSLYHTGCIMTRYNDGELEINFIGRQLCKMNKAIKSMEKKGFSQEIPIFFTVDPVSLRNATADKNRTDVKGLLGYAGRFVKNITNAFLVKLGVKSGGAIVPRIGSLKTVIPDGSIFDLQAFINNVGLVLNQTTGMEMEAASKMAEHYMAELVGREYDADQDALE
jgi:flagellar motility protein MotE (MotC chaperone)